MGHAANSGIVIEESEIAKIVPNELKAFNDLLEKHNVEKSAGLGNGFACEDMYNLEDELEDIDDFESIVEEIKTTFNALCEAFEKATGLNLYANGHDADNDGSRYDEVNGFFWELGNVNQLTPEAKALKDKGIEFGHKNWVTFG